MRVYDQERADGLAEALAGHGKAYVLGVPTRVAPGVAPLRDSILQAAQAAGANPAQPDLYYLSFVLVSTGANQNWDFFDRWETWRARATPEDKQFNYGHDQLDIIGHMTGCRVVAGDAEVDYESDPPETFDILGDSVLYRAWPAHADRQERMDAIIAELESPPDDGGWFVSMECLFPTFDYLVCPLADGRPDTARGKLLARGDKTAFLTKHLRAYGGNGLYQGQAVCRVFRDFVFSGVGLVRNPANPGSVILTASAADKNFPSEDPAGYSLASAAGPQENAMTVEQYEKLVQDLRAELDTAKASVTAEKVKALETKIDELTAAMAELTGQLETATKAVETEQSKAQAIEAEKVALAEKAQAAEAAKAEAEAKLADIAAKAEADRRLAATKIQLELTDEQAVAYVTPLATLDQKAFDAVLDSAVALKKGWSKVSNLPAPAAKEPEKVATIGGGGSEPPAGTTTVTTQASAGLQDAEPTETVAATPAVESPKYDVAKAAADIAAYFDDADETGEDGDAPRKPAKKGRK